MLTSPVLSGLRKNKTERDQADYDKFLKWRNGSQTKPVQNWTEPTCLGRFSSFPVYFYSPRYNIAVKFHAFKLTLAYQVFYEVPR